MRIVLSLTLALAACSSSSLPSDGGECPTGQTPCGPTAACVDLTSDPNDCGGCGKACLPGQTCLEASCTSEITPVCPQGQAFCADAGACVDLDSDPNNCGACNAACTAGQTCLSRVCTSAQPAGDGGVVCPTGFLACALDAGQGCVDPALDPSNCGACGVSCGAFAACSGGVCGCDPLFTSCGTAEALACVDLASDALDCGACGVSCLTCETCGEGTCGSKALYGSAVELPLNGTGGQFLGAGDFDGDGFSDLVVGNGSALSIYRGQSDGGFVSGPTVNALQPFAALVVADFNGDGRSDVAVAGVDSEQMGWVEVLFGQSSGALDAGYDDLVATNVSSGIGGALVLLGTGDVNRDGRPDVVYDVGGQGGLAFSDGDAGNPFVVQAGLPLATAAPGINNFGSVTSIAVVDLNADGLPDLAYRDTATDTLFVADQLGDGGFAPGIQVSSALPSSLAVAPLHLGGPAKLFVDQGAIVAVYAASDAGPVVAEEVTSAPTESAAPVLVAADLNGDGLTDLAAVAGDSSVVTWLNAGDAGFRPAVDSPSFVGFGSQAVAVIWRDAGAPRLATLATSGAPVVLSPTCAAP